MDEFDNEYNEILEKHRGNLTIQEYTELISLEYIITHGYNEKGHLERYFFLKKKKELVKQY
jgi:hypothetical protein